MAFIALKPCKFAGQKFKIGDTVPGELILPGAAKNLVKMQILAPSDSANVAVGGKSASLEAVEIIAGELTLGISKEGLQHIFDALTANVENAEKVVNEMTDGDALILLHMSDSRKSIKAAAEARAKALEEEKNEEDPESKENPDDNGESEDPESKESAGEE